MRSAFLLALISGAAVWGQTQTAAPATGAAAPAQKVVKVQVPAEAVLPITALPPETVIATIDGKKVTAGELQVVLRALPQAVQQQAQADRRKFLEQYGVLAYLADYARQNKLDQQSPYKEAIAYSAMQVLYQAALNDKMQNAPVTAEEVKQTYEAKKDQYSQAKVKAIYLPFTKALVSQADSTGQKLPNEEEARAKAEDLIKQLRAGGDFAALAKQYSKDAKSAQNGGDFGTIKKTDMLPNDLKNAVFTAKIGEITGPVRQPNGFYILRVDEVTPAPLEQVQSAIANDLKNAQMVAWLNGLQKKLDIKMENAAPSNVQIVQPGAAPAPSR